MATNPEEMDIEEVVDPGVNEELEHQEEPKKVEGYMNYEQWIEAGKDPEKFRGRKAFEDHGESIKTIKELNQKFVRFDDTVNELKNRYEADAKAKIEQAKQQILADIEKAKENEDIAAYDVARGKLDTLNASKPPVGNAQPMGVIQEYLSKNPALDRNSPQYDEALYATWAKSYDANLDAILGGDRSKQNLLTQEEIERSMKSAMSISKNLYPEKFTSPRNSRTGAPNPAPKKPAPAQDYRARLKSMTTNTMNRNDKTATMDMYDLLVKKGSKKDADEYAKRVLGD
jgi:hypothetical protein